ncbi:sensor histidine kinase [Cupriavidus gilardii]|uniref:sensor histidine kinase n=1 Tax=Cupriavidus gilardii TaxID=82541 RepID=UPI0015728C2E|nr:sensor histidine kinase [Cupriavidus gilardii]NSX03318.1 sensor histidine kinase [Cupriavidus gilardii]
MAASESRHSLRRRLLWRLTIPLVAVGIFTAFTSYRTALSEANQAHDRTLLASARAIAERLDYRNDRLVVDVPYVALDTFQVDIRGRIFYRVRDPAGRFVSGDRDLPAMPKEVPRSDHYPALVHFYNTDYLGTPLRVAALWQPVADAPDGGMALVEVGETLEMRDDMAMRLLATTLWQQALLIAASIALIALAVHVALRPLKNIEDTLRARDTASLDPIDVPELPREIHPLLASLNSYLASLRSMVSRQSQFLDDASHQLRTALALVRTQADHAVRTYQAKPEWREIRDAIDRTIRLTNQLLALARTDAQPPHAAPGAALHRLDLTALCRAVSAEWYLAARERQLDFGLSARDEVHAYVNGDEGTLREMLANVLDNAVQYTPAGGRVEVTVIAGATTHLVLIDDSGVGIAPPLRDKAFERFVRLGDLRQPGSGLGLAIVRQICEAHGGQVLLEDGPDGRGLRVRIELPAAPEPRIASPILAPALPRKANGPL